MWPKPKAGARWGVCRVSVGWAPVAGAGASHQVGRWQHGPDPCHSPALGCMFGSMHDDAMQVWSQVEPCFTAWGREEGVVTAAGT